MKINRKYICYFIPFAISLTFAHLFRAIDNPCTLPHILNHLFNLNADTYSDGFRQFYDAALLVLRGEASVLNEFTHVCVVVLRIHIWRNLCRLFAINRSFNLISISPFQPQKMQ